MEPITSRENPRIKQLTRLLSEKKARRELGLFVTEGAKLSWEAAQSGIEVRELFCTRRALEHYPQAELLLQHAAQVFELSPELAGRLGDTLSPQGIFCLCAVPEPKLSEQTLPAGRYLALESLQDPGNLGTILRTADAFALSGVLLTADCPDIYSPKVLRSTMGSVFRVPVCTTQNLPALLQAMGATHTTYAATLGGAQSVRECNFMGPCVAVVGNEGGGLTPEAVAACTQRVFIDMPGQAESLNAAVAAAILMWEMAPGNARGKAGHRATPGGKPGTGQRPGESRA